MRPSALSRLIIGIDRSAYFWEAVGNKEVSHAEEVYRPPVQTGTEHVTGGCQETQRRRPEGATCPDFVEGRCEWSCLERQPDRRSLRLSSADGREGFVNGLSKPVFKRLWRERRRANPPIEKLLDGKQEAKIIAMRLGPPPKGYAHWTLRLLARKVVELEIVEDISYETVRRTLKKTG